MPRARKPTPPRFSKATRDLVEQVRECRAVAALQCEVIELRAKVIRLERERFFIESERQQYASFFRHVPIAYVTFDGQGIIRNLNHTAVRLLGWRGSPLNPASFGQFLSQRQLQRLFDHLRRKDADALGWTKLDLDLTRRDGARMEVQCVVAADMTQSSQVLYHAVLLNLSQFRDVERNLREALTGLKLAAQAAGFGTFEYDVTRGQMLWSPELRTILGLPASELPVSLEAVREIIHPEDREKAMRAMRRSLEPDNSGRYEDEHRLLLRNGAVRWVLARGRTTFTGEGKNRQAVRAVGIVFDITHRKLAEEALRDAHGELERRVQERTAELDEANADLKRENAERQRLEREILAISDRERQRIGQDLHDGLGQQLTGIAMMQSAIAHTIEAHGLPGTETAERMAELIAESRREVRRITRGLHPVQDEPDALMKSLAQLIAGLPKTRGTECRFQCPSPVLVRDSKVATHLFRIAQEALGNALRHGKARRIVVRLTCNGDIKLEVRDDGAGFPKNAPNRGGLGLRIMRSRAEAIGGHIEFLRAPRGGALVRCTVPKN